MDDFWRKEEKLSWLSEKDIENIDFENISPDKSNNWINQNKNDWEELVPIIDKEVKAGKSGNAIFKLFSRGVATQRDEWVYDFSKGELENKVKFLVDVYEKTRSDHEYVQKNEIKWDRELAKYLERDIKKNFDKIEIEKALYRPFVKPNFYFDKHFNALDENTELHGIPSIAWD